MKAYKDSIVDYEFEVRLVTFLQDQLSELSELPDFPETLASMIRDILTLWSSEMRFNYMQRYIEYKRTPKINIHTE